MADKTKIEWTDATWNVVNGCTVHSPGCTNCYAMKQAHRFPPRQGLTVKTNGGMVWTGEVRFNEAVLTQPLRWKRPRRIFVCAHGDLFHESVPDEWIDRVFAVMALCPQHQFQVLTKRSARMREYLSSGRSLFVWRETRNLGLPEQKRRDRLDSAVRRHVFLPLPNVWLGVSVEDQKRADERVPDLLATPAAVRWLSCEPLLGPVSLEEAWHGENALDSECWGDCAWCDNGYPALSNCSKGRQSEAEFTKGRSGLDWIVVGGESGPKARPMHPDWARSLRDQCEAAGVSFLFKQWGEWAPGEVAGDFLNPDRAAKGVSYFDGRWDECWSYVDGHCDDEPDLYRIGKKRAGRLLDGVEHNGFPADRT